MSAATIVQTPIASARDVARYFLALATEDGDLITNLKMQKLVYYAYAHTLVQHGRKLFGERIEAWPNGPVVRTLYSELKQYKARPIDEQFLGYDIFADGREEGANEAAFDAIAGMFPDQVRETLEAVYNTYMPKSAFELVTSTHNERPWVEARRGLASTDYCEVALSDQNIMAEFAASVLA